MAPKISFIAERAISKLCTRRTDSLSMGGPPGLSSRPRASLAERPSPVKKRLLRVKLLDRGTDGVTAAEVCEMSGSERDNG